MSSSWKTASQNQATSLGDRRCRSSSERRPCWSMNRCRLLCAINSGVGRQTISPPNSCEGTDILTRAQDRTYQGELQKGTKRAKPDISCGFCAFYLAHDSVLCAGNFWRMARRAPDWPSGPLAQLDSPDFAADGFGERREKRDLAGVFVRGGDAFAVFLQLGLEFLAGCAGPAQHHEGLHDLTAHRVRL